MNKAEYLPLIIYEGPENSGKTTIKRKVNELIDHKSISWERWTGTAYAYGVVFEREPDLNRLLEMDYNIDSLFNILLVYLSADPRDLLKRVNTDPMPGNKYKLNARRVIILREAFNRWFFRSPIENKLRFDTSVTKPDFIAKHIKEILERI